MKMKLVVLAVVLGLVGFAPAAHASQFLLTNDNCTGGCGASLYGTVTLTQAGTNVVNVAVALEPNTFFVHTGFDASFAFNLVGGPSVTFSNVSTDWTALSSTAGSIHIDGFGNLMYGLTFTGHGGSTLMSGPLTFDVTATGLTPSSFELFSTGNDAVYFAADIYGPNGLTGPVGTCSEGEDCTPTVPEPASMLLLGSGLLGAGFLRKRRNRK